MTIARPRRKPFGGFPLHAAALLAVLALGPARAATTEQVVADYRTGLAISGYDPVAYVFEAAAVEGRADLEFRFGGATWRFQNEGNRAAFAADPQVYLPRFGGYDPVSVARGASAPGHPEIWLVVQDRLYLFHSPAARDAFAADPDAVLDAAERRWPEVLRTLTP